MTSPRLLQTPLPGRRCCSAALLALEVVCTPAVLEMALAMAMALASAMVMVMVMEMAVAASLALHAAD